MIEVNSFVDGSDNKNKDENIDHEHHPLPF